MGVLSHSQAAIAFLPNLFRAFAYFPSNLHTQPFLFMFHGVLLMVICPLCRLAILFLYRWFIMPYLKSHFLGCILLSFFFAVLMLAVSYPGVHLLGLPGMED